MAAPRTDEELLEAVRESFGQYRDRVADRHAAGEPGGFDVHLLSSMTVERAEPLEGGRVLVVVACEPDGRHQNVLGAMHGGAVATAVDVATSFALEGLRILRGRPPLITVSVSLGVDFVRPAIGRVLFECVGESVGRRLCHTSCRVTDGAGRTIATGKHVKAIVSGEPSL